MPDQPHVPGSGEGERQRLIQVMIGPCSRGRASHAMDDLLAHMMAVWPELGAAVAIDFEPNLTQSRVVELEAQVAELTEALKEVRAALGPNPGCASCCEGCAREMEIALDAARSALERGVS